MDILDIVCKGWSLRKV